MSHFADQFRYKFDKESQRVLFSVSITEQRVIEHSIPALNFWEMANSYRQDENYSSDPIKMKQLGSSILMTIRQNEFTRRSYKFTNSEFQRLMGKFRRSVDEADIDKNIEFDPMEIHVQELAQRITENIHETIPQSDNTEVLLKIKRLENMMGKLSKQITEISEAITLLSEKGISRQIESVEPVFDTEMPMFIPSTVKTEFVGTVKANTEQAEDDNVSSATKLLKKMKSKKGAKK